jgi:diacylglycerol kinase (ATP)
VEGAGMSADAGNSAVRPHAKPRGVRRLLNAFVNTWGGLAGCWREEEAFRQECLLALAAVPAGLWFGSSGVERALLVGPMLLILIVELLNSAIEAAIDRIGVERHALSGLAKDLGSAAVFVSFLLLGANWVLVLLDR